MAAASYYKLDQFTPGVHAPPGAPARPQEPPNYDYGSDAYAGYSNQEYGAKHPKGPDPKGSEPLLQPLGPPGAHNVNQGGPARLNEKKLHKASRRQRITKLASKTCTVIFTGAAFAIMVDILVVHQQTIGVFRDGRDPWPKDPKIWPTYMLLAASGFSVVLALVSLLFYCCAYDRARRSWKLTLVRNLMHLLTWAVVSFLYRYEKSLHGKSNDLWGWTCSPEAQKIQANFQDVIHFKPLCRAQSSSWGLSLAEFSVKMIFAIFQCVFHRDEKELEKKRFADRTGGALAGLAEHLI